MNQETLTGPWAATCICMAKNAAIPVTKFMCNTNLYGTSVADSVPHLRVSSKSVGFSQTRITSLELRRAPSKWVFFMFAQLQLGLTCRLTPVPTIYDCCLHCTFNLTFLKKGGLGRVIESIKVVAQESARHRSWLKNPRATIVVALNFARH
eukprot:scaffold7897_cov20-Tisochrysis_lutea.AAC.1